MTKPAKTFYIASTRMNFIAAIDSGLLAPPEFYIRRKFYEENDVSRFYPHSQILSIIPVHIAGSWTSENEELNFPIILEVVVRLPEKLETISLKYGKLVQKTGQVSMRSVKEEAYLFPGALPLSSIRKVFVPSERKIFELREDPYLVDIEIHFDINVSDKVEFSTLLSTITKDKILPEANEHASVDNLEWLLSIAGGLAMAGETLRQQCWEEEWHSAEILAATIAALEQTSAPGESVEPENLCYLDGFGEIKWDNHPDAISRLGLIVLNVQGDNFATWSKELLSKTTQMDLFESQETSRFVYSNTMALGLLAKVFADATPADLSPSEVVDKASNELLELTIDSVTEELERLSKGLQVVVENTTGLLDHKALFKNKVKWATSVRAAMLFCLRPDPVEMIEWEREARPQGANLIDLTTAAFLCGLYHGYSALPVSIKNRWQPLIDEFIIRYYEKAPRKINKTACWYEDNGLIKGALRLEIDGAGTLEFLSGISAAKIIRDYVDLITADVISGKPTDLDRYIMSIIANQKNLYQFKLLEFTFKNTDLLHGVKGRKLNVRENEVEVIHSWDFPGIVEYLSELHELILPSEILALICKRLKYQYFDYTPNQQIEFLTVISGWLRNHAELVKKNFCLSCGGYEGTVSIHAKGEELLSCLAEIFDTGGLAKIQELEMLKAFIYVALPRDIISENVDPDIGMIDDWIILSCITVTMFDKVPKGKSKKWKELSRKAKGLAENLKDKIATEFGEDFVASIVKKSGVPLA